jgi:hypothetical protein
MTSRANSPELKHSFSRAACRENLWRPSVFHGGAAHDITCKFVLWVILFRAHGMRSIIQVALLSLLAAGLPWRPCSLAQEAAAPDPRQRPRSDEQVRPDSRRPPGAWRPGRERGGFEERDRGWPGSSSRWPDRRPPGDWDRFGDRGSQPQRPRVDVWESGPIVGGYVLLHGQYIAPPYKLRREDQKLLINDHALEQLLWTEKIAPHSTWTPAMLWFDRLRQALASGALVIVEKNENSAGDQPVVLDRSTAGLEFLQRIADPAAKPSTSKSALAPRWETWLGNFQPPAELVARAKKDVAFIIRSRTKAVEDVPAVGYWAYPLTALGMFLTAVAVGQLFVSRSLLTGRLDKCSPEVWQLAGRCILIVVGLSLLDLIWTLLAMRANVIHELNPLATHFLTSPLALVSFKLGVTCAGAWLLYSLRAHHPARLASWWLCLVCTLVTVRWVAFTSLFVA